MSKETPAINLEPDFETTINDLKCYLGKRNDEFSRAVHTGMSLLEKSKSVNRAIGAKLLAFCVACESRGDAVTARMLMHASGASVNPVLAEMTCLRVMAVSADGAN